MTLRELRCLFTSLVPRLIDKARELGYECALGEVERSKLQAQANADSGAGTSNSLHIVGLAVDLHLYRGGAYLTKSEDHAELGTYWKSLHPLARWGGDFTTIEDGKVKSKPDGNHYSIEWQGRK